MASFRFFQARFAGTIRSACFDFEFLFSRDFLPFQNCSACDSSKRHELVRAFLRAVCEPTES